MSAVRAPAADPPAEASPAPAPSKPPKPFDRPRFLPIFTGVFFIFMFAPIFIVALFSFNSSKSLQRFEGFSLEWYRRFFEDESLRESLVASIQIATARARRPAGKKSPSSDVDAGEQVASPTPTPSRATISCAKLRATPDAAVSRLQTKTPTDRILRRSVRSDSRPSGRPTTA